MLISAISRGIMEEEGRRWEDLESDCLLNIFQRLSPEDLTLGVPFACKSWCEASRDPFCWRVLDFQASDFTPGSKLAGRFQATLSPSSFSFTGFLKLAVSRGRKQAVQLRFPHDASSIRDVDYASSECPRLKAVALPNLAPQDELHLPRLVGRWRDLERLEMDLKPSCFPELVKQIGINCAGFSELTVCGSIQRGDALAIASLAPRLRRLDLSRSHLPRDELLVIMKGCGEIERLSANCCIGFQADKQLLEMASGIGVFEHEGSKLWDCYVHKRL